MTEKEINNKLKHLDEIIELIEKKVSLLKEHRLGLVQLLNDKNSKK